MRRSEQRGPGRPYHGAVSYTTRFVRAGTALAVISVLGWLGGCSDHPGGPVIERVADSLIVSDPVLPARFASGTGAASARESSAEDGVAYVSLRPGTAPSGKTATIRRVGGGAERFMAVFDGGFDPVPVGAGVGDSIDVIVRNAADGTVLEARLAVAARRPPVVVRTEPPRKKTDVPLNTAIVIVFSEPVAGNTVTASSVRLFRGTTAVPGTVTLLAGTGAVAQFATAVPLAANSQYRLEITPAVRDLDGEALTAGVTVTFMTGTATTGPPASVQTSPDSTLALVTGASYQVAATVRDAAGNLLPNEPVTWSSSDPNVLTVSLTGLVTALGDGFSTVIASAGGLSDRLYVFINAAPAASVTIAPTPATVAAGDTIVLAATVRDAADRTINRPSLTWTSSDQAVATVAGAQQPTSGIVTGVSAGSVTITATSGTASGTASITVAPPRPVASVTLSPASATLISQAMVQLSATLRDANGGLIPSRPITWQSDNEGVATVDASGLVTAVGIGSAGVTATSEGVSDTTAISVTTITFRSVNAGYEYTCGVTTEDVAYCWGVNFYGQLGNDLPPQDLYPNDPDYAGQWFYDGSFLPTPVRGGLTFSMVSPGGVHTCGLTPAGAAHCWGVNGEIPHLGIGSNSPTPPDGCHWDIYTPACIKTPVAVVGGLTFLTLNTGEGDAWTPDYGHTCGLTTGGAAYCWGANSNGELGNGSTGLLNSSAVPVPVAGGLTFTTVGLGSTHSCGLTISGAAYCWGDNRRGKLGSGSGESSSAVPVAVTGGRTFTSLSVGAWHTCGLTASGEVYCWGSNYYGQLGNGSMDTSAVPVAVTGGLTFAALSVGGFHTCALTAAGEAYCWGINRNGELGLGSDTGPNQCATATPFPYPCSPTPLAVTGGLSFATLSAGGVHTCGLTTSGVAYCWGKAGPIGSGAREGSSVVPVKVAGQP